MYTNYSVFTNYYCCCFCCCFTFRIQCASGQRKISNETNHRNDNSHTATMDYARRSKSFEPLMNNIELSSRYSYHLISMHSS